MTNFLDKNSKLNILTHKTAVIFLKIIFMSVIYLIGKNQCISLIIPDYFVWYVKYTGCHGILLCNSSEFYCNSIFPYYFHMIDLTWRSATLKPIQKRKKNNMKSMWVINRFYTTRYLWDCLYVTWNKHQVIFKFLSILLPSTEMVKGQLR